MNIITTSSRSLRFAAFAAAAISLSACSGGGDEGAPTITSFTATPTSVASGASASLAWAVVDATKITITGGADTIESADASGTASTGALTANTTFTLTAENDKGMSTQTVMVTIQGVGGPTVDSFTASPLAIMSGESADLTWMTTDATTVNITAGGTSIVMDGAADGSFTVMPDTTTTYTLIASDAGGANSTPSTVTVMVNVTTPTVLAFAANPTTVDAGMATTLTWDVVLATSIIVTDDQANEVYNGTDLQGSAMDSPTQTTTYTITVTDGTDTDTDTVTVTVNPPAGAAIQSFTASPMLAVDGQNVDLSWMVSNADRIEIDDGVSLLPIHTSTNAAGTYTTQMLPQDVTYTLTAFNALGDATAMVTVTLSMAAPVVNDFSANPNPGGVGGISTLSWDVAAAATIDIADGAGTLIVTATTTAAGTFDVTLAGPTNDYTLTATNQFGTTMATLSILADAAAPVVNTFTATPDIGTDPVMVTIDYDVTAARTLVLLANGTPVTTFPFTANGMTQDVVGQFMITLTQSTQFELNAANGAGTDSDNVTVVVAPPGTLEIEPNDTATQAIALVGLINTRVGSIGVPNDEDWYSVTVGAGGFVRAQTSDGAGGCALDTLLRLYDTDGITELASNDDGGVGLCSFLDPNAIPALTALPAGTYYVVVEAFSDRVGNYVLDIEVGVPGCGNGLLEMGENCDDGNTTAGDGCNATCQFEPNQTFSSPGAAQTLTANIVTIGDIYLLQVDVTATSYLRAETFEVASTQTCDNANTVMRLLDGTGAVLGTDFGDGVNSCSRINESDAFARLDVGTFFLSIEESGNNAAIAALELVVEGVAADICGNGVIEGGLNETCDDGNTTAGDGCDATCQQESVLAYSSPGAPTTFSTPVTVAGLQPFITVTVTTESYLRAGTFVDAAAGTCPAGNDTVIRLFDSGGVELGSDDDGGVSPCSLIDPNVDAFARLTAGTYTIRVEEFGNNGIIDPLETVLEGITVDICGNGVVEAGINEACDDGNTTAGDGCNATCQLEALPGITVSPGSTQTLVNQSIPLGIPNVFPVTVTAEVYISAETFVDAAAGTCPAIDTVIRLFQSDGVTEIVNDDQGGVASCSAINVALDGQLVRLAAGSYFLQVEDFLNNTAIADYDLVVNGIAVDVCGNGAIELAETCDDGNTTANDGCSATCTVEAAGAIALSAGSVDSFLGRSLAIGQQDTFTITVTGADVYISAETFVDSVALTCPVLDTDMTLLQSDGVTTIVADDFDGVGSCSLINPTRDGQLARLAAGTYFLRIEEDGNNAAVAAYDLIVNGLATDICGNGILELAETCDDGNLTPGDGCNAVCATEIAGTIALSPGSTDSFLARALAIGQQDTFQITVAAPVYISAEVFVDSVALTCPTLDTDMTLLQSDGVTTIVADDFDGVGSCSLINVARDGQLARLAAGTYFLRIEEDGNNAAVAAYDLIVNGIAVDICGNGIIEGTNNETCDDGNTTAGDGCDAVCAFEGVAEAEPNNDRATATNTTLVTAGSVLTAGDITVVGDQDYYSFVIPAAGATSVTAETWGLAGPGTCDGDTRIYLEDAAGVELGNDDDDGFGLCSFIQATDVFATNLAPGTFYLRVQHFNNTGSGIPYIMSVSLQ